MTTSEVRGICAGNPLMIRAKINTDNRKPTPFACKLILTQKLIIKTNNNPTINIANRNKEMNKTLEKIK